MPALFMQGITDSFFVQAAGTLIHIIWMYIFVNVYSFRILLYQYQYALQA